jgi:hypothetical protein
VLDTWNRAERYRDLAEDCRRLATATLSIRMKKRYLVMARDYILLADVEEQARAHRARPRLQKMPGKPGFLP